MIDFDADISVGTLPQVITFETELEAEGQRADLLATVIEMVAQKQKLMGLEESVQKPRTLPWDKEIIVSLPNGQKVQGTLTSQREKVSVKSGEKYYWTSSHEIGNSQTKHVVIRYKAILQYL
jgi:hypothetical protein